MLQYTAALEQVGAEALAGGEGDCAAAVRALRTEGTASSDSVLGGISAATVRRHLAAAAKAAGVKGRITAHSGRIGLATELTRRGASLQEVMLASNWSTARMVAHYCTGARGGDSAAVAGLLRHWIERPSIQHRRLSAYS